MPTISDRPDSKTGLYHPDSDDPYERRIKREKDIRDWFSGIIETDMFQIMVGKSPRIRQQERTELLVADHKDLIRVSVDDMFADREGWIRVDGLHLYGTKSVIPNKREMGIFRVVTADHELREKVNSQQTTIDAMSRQIEDLRNENKELRERLFRLGEIDKLAAFKLFYEMKQKAMEEK